MDAQQVLSYFAQYAFIAGHSPLLNDCDPQGEDDETLHINWVCNEEGDRDCINIPHSRMDEARFSEDGATLVLVDDEGDEIRVQFFSNTPVRLNTAGSLGLPSEVDPLDSLIQAHGGSVWDEHPHFTRAHWQYEVANGDTVIGYWPWVQSELEASFDESS